MLRTPLAALLLAACSPAAPPKPSNETSAQVTQRFALGAVPPARFVDLERRARIIAALPQIETIFHDWMKESKVPGASVALVVDGDVVYAKGFGVRDVASGAPVDPDTIFRIASMTKSFTALAILKLRDDGKLGLDEPA